MLLLTRMPRQAGGRTYNFLRLFVFSSLWLRENEECTQWATVGMVCVYSRTGKNIAKYKRDYNDTVGDAMVLMTMVVRNG